MKADAKTEAEVMDTINKFNEAYVKKDLDSALKFLTPDPDGIFIGTGLDEKCLGLEEMKRQLKRDFAQSDDLSWDSGWHSVSAAGQVAWVSGDLTLHAKIGGRKISLPMRSTAVLEKRRGKWLVVQLHNSMPYPEQKARQSFPK